MFVSAILCLSLALATFLLKVIRAKTVFRAMRKYKLIKVWNFRIFRKIVSFWWQVLFYINGANIKIWACLAKLIARGGVEKLLVWRNSHVFGLWNPIESRKFFRHVEHISLSVKGSVYPKSEYGSCFQRINLVKSNKITSKGLFGSEVLVSAED